MGAPEEEVNPQGLGFTGSQDSGSSEAPLSVFRTRRYFFPVEACW